MDNLKEKNLIKEINDLMNSIESIKEEVDVYCSLMKQMFLSGSNSN